MSKQPEVPAGLFAPRQNRQESKADATTTAARSILTEEAKSRDAKTAKLRALRLAQMSEAEPVAPRAKTRAKAAKK